MLRIGCLGAARITPAAIVGPAKARSDVTVSAIAARDFQRAKAFALRHGVPVALNDYTTLIASTDIDAIYIGLPPAAHARFSIAALEAGKHVLCEKPLCMHAAEAEAIAAAARASGKVFMEAYHWRHHESFARMQALLAQIGAIQSAQARFSVGIAYRPEELRWSRGLGGGAMMDLGCYPLHILRTIFAAEPRIVAVQAQWRHGVDASLAAVLDFNGCAARLSCSMDAEKPEAMCEVRGEAGVLRFDTFVAPQRGGKVTLKTDSETILEQAAGPDTYTAQLANFVDACAGRAPPLVTLDDSLAQMRAIDAIYADALRSRP